MDVQSIQVQALITFLMPLLIQLAKRSQARFGGWHTAGEILFHLLFQMEARLLAEILFDTLPACQGAQPHAEDIPPAPQLHCTITNPTARDKRSHCANSFSSCARPALVSS